MMYVLVTCLAKRGEKGAVKSISEKLRFDFKEA
jgi:hypothetical protein